MENYIPINGDDYRKFHPKLEYFEHTDVDEYIARTQYFVNRVSNRLGEKYGTAFLIVVHTDNQCPIPGRKKISNSADIWNIGRSVLRVGETEEKNINYIAHEKSDYGQLCKTVLYRVEDERVIFEECRRTLVTLVMS